MKFLHLARFLLLILTVVVAPAAHATAAPRPNVVFIFADDWGWGDLSSHGHPWLKTPHLDQLAREGTDFQQFNVLNPVCSPSRAAAMTGHYHHSGQTRLLHAEKSGGAEGSSGNYDHQKAGHNWREVGTKIEPSRTAIIERTVHFFVDHFQSEQSKKSSAPAEL